MANATWKAIKSIFASETTTTVLGSTVAGTPQTTTDPDLLSANFGKGLDGNWQEITINGTQYWLPLISEWNGIYSCFSQYFKQLFENGFVLWSADQTYSLTPSPSIVKDSASSNLYITLINDNKGNLLTDNTKWKLLCNLNDLTYLQSNKFNTANNLVQTDSNNKISNNLLNISQYIPDRILLSNNSTNPNTQIDFSAGNFEFSDKSDFANLTAQTGDLSLNFGTGLGMLDIGTKAPSTWYYCYAIYNPTTNVSKVLCSTAVPNLSSGAYTGANMPSGYTKNRYIGAYKTESNGNLFKTGQFNNKRIFLNGPMLDATGTLSGTIVAPLFSIPPIPVEVKVNIYAHSGSGQTLARVFVYSHLCNSRGSGSADFSVNFLAGNWQSDGFIEKDIISTNQTIKIDTVYVIGSGSSYEIRISSYKDLLI